jgi:hypothetical protein
MPDQIRAIIGVPPSFLHCTYSASPAYRRCNLAHGSIEQVDVMTTRDSEVRPQATLEVVLADLAEQRLGRFLSHTACAGRQLGP